MGPKDGLDGCGKFRPPPSGVRSPDRPARSESLYRLRYISNLWCSNGLQNCCRGRFGRNQNNIVLGGYVFSWFLRRYNNFLMGRLYKLFGVCFRVDLIVLPTRICESP